jgi:hypothetical protein
LAIEHLDRSLDDSAKSSGHTAGQDHGRHFTLPHRLLAAIRQRAPYVTTKGWEGPEISFIGWLHLASDAILGSPQLASGQSLSKRFKGDVLESEALKKLGRLRVYV